MMQAKLGTIEIGKAPVPATTWKALNQRCYRVLRLAACDGKMY